MPRPDRYCVVVACMWREGSLLFKAIVAYQLHFQAKVVDPDVMYTALKIIFKRGGGKGGCLFDKTVWGIVIETCIQWTFEVRW